MEKGFPVENRHSGAWRRGILIAALVALVLGVIVFFYLLVGSAGEVDSTLPSGQTSLHNVSRQKAFTAYNPERLLPAVDASVWDTSVPVAPTIDTQYSNTDCRMVALPMLGDVDRSYFDRATFVGDSIVSGLGIYSSGLPNAKYVVYTGASANTFVNNGSHVNAVTKVEETPKEALVATQPNVVYILCGTNSLQQLNTEDGLIAYYGRMLDEFRELLPDALFYVQAIPFVQEYVKDGDGEHMARPGLYPERIENVNNLLANLALSKGCYFLNINETLANPDGNMKDEFDAGYDGVHFNAAGYKAWAEYLATHTVWSAQNLYLSQNPYSIEEAS